MQVNKYDFLFAAMLNQTGEEANSNGMVNVMYNDTAPEGEHLCYSLAKIFLTIF